jgi:hypothetical protein
MTAAAATKQLHRPMPQLQATATAAARTAAAAPKATTTIQISDRDFLDNFIHTDN